MWISRAIILIFTLTLLTPAYTKNYAVVHGSQFLLEIYDEEDHLIRTYPVGLGKNRLGKRARGDLKTPLGEYHVLWKASCYWTIDGGLPITNEIGYCSSDNTYSLMPQEGNSNTSLYQDIYGGPWTVFLMLDYPNPSDQLLGYTGNGIAIHATLSGGIGEYSSAGCIRLSPLDARNLYQYLEVGSKVLIQID